MTKRTKPHQFAMMAAIMFIVGAISALLLKRIGGKRG